MSLNRRASPIKRLQWKWHDFIDYFFRTREGAIVITQVPNAPLIVFIISAIYGVVSYHGFWHSLAQVIALLSIIVWGILEHRSGVNRFRKTLGRLSVLAAVLVVLLYVLG